MTLQRDHSGRFYDDTQDYILYAKATAERHVNIGHCLIGSSIEWFYKYHHYIFNTYMEAYVIAFNAAASED